MKNEDKNKSFVPAIRFKGFTEDWEQRELDKISKKVTKKNKNLICNEVFTNSAEFGIISQNDYFDKAIANSENIDNYYIVENNDFVYNPRISTLAPFGPIRRNKLNKSGAMSPLYYVFKTFEVDAGYLEYYFKTNLWYSFMFLNGNTGARADRFAIRDEVFKKMPISMPQNITEQVNIGGFFSTLDNIVTLHQRKLEILRKLKKYYLQTMFATGGDTMPCLRFSGYSGEWVGKKLNNCVKHIHTGLNPRDNFKLNNGGSFFYVTIKNIIHGRLSFENCDRIDGKALQLVQKRSDLQVNDVLFSSIGRIGDCYVITEPPKNWNINESVFSIRPLDNVIAPYYLVAVLKTKKIIDTLTNSTTGSTFKSIKKAQLLDLEISTPTLPEQAQIGDFFQHLDTLLERYERVINLLQKMKQFYLQKMFP